MLPDSVTPDLVRRQLDELLASPVFVKAGRMSEMLRYLVEESLAGRSGSLKESVIGPAVLGRGSDFDPKVDPTVRVEMRRLRSKLGEFYLNRPDASVLIEIPKGSYSPVFSRIAHPTPTLVRKPRTRELWTVTALLFSAVALGGFARHVFENPSLTSIAIVPPVDLTDDSSQARFSEGIADEIASELSRGGELHVHRCRADNATDLKPDAVLTGSVRVSGSKRRISFHLVGTAESRQIWSYTFERDGGDPIALQREIGRAVVNHLKPSLKARHNPYVAPMAAKDLYWRGRSHQYNGELPQAVDTFRRVIVQEPAYALAWAALGEVLGGHARKSSLNPDFSPAIAAGMRAAEIDPYLAEAHVSLGVTRSRMFDWSGAEAEFKRAIALDKDYASAHGEYAQNILLPMRRFEEAERESWLCVKADPNSFYGQVRHGVVLMYRGKYADAMKYLQKAAEIDPRSEWPARNMARVLILQGRPEEAIGAVNGRDAVLMAVAHATADRLIEARRWAERALKSSEYGPVSRITALAAIGRVEEAVRIAEDPATRCSLLFSMLGADPLLSELRTNARFAKVLETAGLPR